MLLALKYVLLATSINVVCFNPHCDLYVFKKKKMTTTVALIALICIVILGSGADKNSNICPYVGAAWGHIYLLALCSRNVVKETGGKQLI